MDVLIEVILPIFLVAGAGYLVGRLSGDDARQLRDLRSRGPSVRLRRGRLHPRRRLHADQQPDAGDTALLGADGLLRSVLILATHFNRRPELAAAVVFLTTGLSLGSLTLILSILN